MNFGSERLADILLAYPGRADACATVVELGALAADTVGLVGMTAIACGMVTGPRVARDELFHFHTWPPAWLAHYVARGFMDHDPLPRFAIVSGAPARWSEVLQRLPPNDPGREIDREARRFGFAEGVIVPVRTANGHLGLVSAGGPAAVIPAETFHFLVTICGVTLHRADALDNDVPPPPPPRLSRREQECVTLLVQGLTEQEIADRLHISDATARFHLDNARAKTGARSRTHLAGIAGLWLGQRNHLKR